MPIYKISNDTDLRWGVWHVTETLVQLVSLVPYGDDLLAEAASRFTSTRRKVEWITVRVLLHHLLGGEHEVDYLPSGRPFLEDHSHQISISHTAGYVAVALHPNREVGIDIEERTPRVLQVKSRFMHPDECAIGVAQDVALVHWCAKETMFKLIDTTGVDFCKHLRINPFILQAEGDIEGYEKRTPEAHKFHIHYDIAPEYVMTLGTMD